MVLAPTLSVNGSYGLATVDYNAVVVSGAGTAAVNGVYAYNGLIAGKPAYLYDSNLIEWNSTEAQWTITDGSTGDAVYVSEDDTANPWQVTTWNVFNDGVLPVPILTPATV